MSKKSLTSRLQAGAEADKIGKADETDYRHGEGKLYAGEEDENQYEQGDYSRYDFTHVATSLRPQKIGKQRE